MNEEWRKRGVEELAVDDLNANRRAEPVAPRRRKKNRSFQKWLSSITVTPLSPKWSEGVPTGNSVCSSWVCFLMFAF